MSRLLTGEQQRVVDTVCDGIDSGKIIAVNAVAGSGKTSTGDAVIRAFQPKNGFYTAFNKAIVQDSAKRFGNLLQCKTIHALAYKYVRPKGSIEDLTYTTIKEDISYEDKATIIETIDDFFRSSSLDIEEFAKSKTHNEELQKYIMDYANMMLCGDIPPTFNYMLKCLHMMLADGDVDIDFDLLILDECQDTTAVALEIFKLIHAKKKVIFGDKYQNIYSFMNTVNAFEELDNLELLRLTKSFRCNPHIASIVEDFSQRTLESDFIYTGNEDLPDETKSIAYITRTNAALIERMDNLLERGETFSLTRNVNEIFALPIALLNASNGKQVYDKKYKFLEKEYNKYRDVKSNFRSFFEYLSLVVSDPLIDSTCKVLINFANKRINIYDLKEKVKSIKPNKNIILTTAHAFKGLEADSVYIEDDLNNSVNRSIVRMKEINYAMAFDRPMTLSETRRYLDGGSKEDLNTYYVALSRARSHIANVGYVG